MTLSASTRAPMTQTKTDLQPHPRAAAITVQYAKPVFAEVGRSSFCHLLALKLQDKDRDRA